MYPWKTIRLACTILLLIPLVHVAYLISRDTLEIMDNSTDAWRREINNYIEQDARTQLPAEPLVVVGGRRVKLWRGLEDALAPRPVLMRGLGGAIVEDITANYDRLIGFYQPHCVVLLTGTSERVMRDNKSPEELTEAIARLAAMDARKRDSGTLYVFTPLKTPLRESDDPFIERSSELLQAWAFDNARVVVLDANPLLEGPDGRPNPLYFRGDGTQLNEHGYLRLTVLLQARLEIDEPLGAPLKAPVLTAI